MGADGDRSEFEMESLNIEDEEVEELNFYYADYSR